MNTFIVHHRILLELGWGRSAGRWTRGHEHAAEFDEARGHVGEISQSRRAGILAQEGAESLHGLRDAAARLDHLVKHLGPGAPVSQRHVSSNDLICAAAHVPPRSANSPGAPG